MNFQEAQELLMRRAKETRGIAPQRMRNMVGLLGLNDFVEGENKPLFFHVAGTNGKGSTVCFLQRLLVEHGFKTGACASPFVYTIRERAQVDLDLIAEAEVIEIVQELEPVAEMMEGSSFGRPGFFDLVTLMAFILWHRRQVQAAAVEVGIGGRLDSTNVVDPACSLIVSIGWDHMDLLGDTLAKIAWQKAGIIKQGRPSVMGALPEEAADVVRAEARAMGSPVWEFGRDLRVESRGDTFDLVLPTGVLTDLRLRMTAEIQKHNAALAVGSLAAAGLSLDPEKVRRALAAAAWPGRFEAHQWMKLPLVLDGAHNPSAAEVLASELQARYPGAKVGVIGGMTEGHAAGPFVAAMKQVVHEWAWVDTPGPKGRSGSDVQGEAQIGKWFPAIREAGLWLKERDCEVICVTGSFYLLGPAHDGLGLTSEWRSQQ
jgi:dihydrofolate synthase/folylpolyglutamate synthase